MAKWETVPLVACHEMCTPALFYLLTLLAALWASDNRSRGPTPEATARKIMTTNGKIACQELEITRRTSHLPMPRYMHCRYVLS